MQERWRIAAVLGVVGVVAVCLWQFQSNATVPAPNKVDRAASIAAASASAPHAALAPASAVAAPRMPGDEEIEVCGFGFMSAEEAARVEALQLQADSPLLARRAADTLHASPIPEAHALGTWLLGIDAAERAAAPIDTQVERCGESQDCRTPLLDEVATARKSAARAAVDALAHEAVGSTSPAVYAMAVQACGSFDTRAVPTGNCQLITLERWAQLDPDNAIPWTHLAGAAAANGDGAAAAEALYRASIARTSRLYGDSLLAIAEPALSSGMSDIEREQIAFEIVGIQATWTFPPFGAAARLCSEEAIRDGNREQVCEAYASMLLERGNTLVERGMGVRLAERLHWPAERLEALRREREAMIAAQLGAVPPDLRSCVGRKRAIDASLRMARLGEVGSARATIAASGRSIDDWAFAERGRRRAAASAAAAASAR